MEELSAVCDLMEGVVDQRRSRFKMNKLEGYHL